MQLCNSVVFLNWLANKRAMAVQALRAALAKCFFFFRVRT